MPEKAPMSVEWLRGYNIVAGVGREKAKLWGSKEVCYIMWVDLHMDAEIEYRPGGTGVIGRGPYAISAQSGTTSDQCACTVI